MHRRIIFLLVLSLIPFAAWSAPKAQAPSHRGPMTKAELRQVYRNFRKGPDKALRAAAKRVLRADKEGRPYRGRKYEVVETMPGELVTIKERGKKLDERSHAKLELDTGAVVVHGRAYRQEQGKSTRSQISLSVWGDGFRLGRAPTNIQREEINILESRESPSNQTPGMGRHSIRLYTTMNGWTETMFQEADGNYRRHGKELPTSDIKHRSWFPRAAE